MPNQTINLGDEGLNDGDEIDPYLSEHFVSGNEVIIPAGEYEWNKGGISGDYSDATLRGDASDGEIVLNRPSTETGLRTYAVGGTVRIENITFKGISDPADSDNWRIQAEAGCTLELVNVNQPDGSAEYTKGTGFYVGPPHAGTIRLERCYVANFANNGLYGSPPGMRHGEDGAVEVIDCDFRNNNIANIRLGSDGCIIRNTRSIHDGKSPVFTDGGHNQRSIWINEAGDNIQIEDVDIYHDGYGTFGIGITETDSMESGGNERNSGDIQNVRITNNGGGDSVLETWDTTDYWTGSDIHLTGSNTSVHPDQFSTVTGSSADSAATSTEAVWRPTDGDTGNGGGDGDDQPEGTSHLVITETASGDLSYTFDVNGEVYYAPESEGESNDEITQTGDESYTVEGFTGNGADDGYYFDGNVTNWSASGEFQLYLNGTEVSVQELLADSGDEGDSNFGDSPCEGPPSNAPGGGETCDGCDAVSEQRIREIVREELSQKALTKEEMREISSDSVEESLGNLSFSVSLDNMGDDESGE